MESFFKRVNWRTIAPFIGAIIILGLFLGTLFFSDVEQAVALPQVASTTFPYVNGNVNEIIRGQDGLFYLGGDFTYLGSYTGCTTIVNKTTMAEVSGRSKIFSYCHVDTAIPDGANGWYIGGSFSDIGGDTTYKSVAHILSNGQVDSSFTSPNLGGGTVYALAYDQTHNVLFIGGSWYGAAGDRVGLAAADASSGTLLEWYANVSDFTSVRSLMISENTLYVGGGFSTISGISRSGLAAIDITNILTDTTGSPTSWDPSIVGGEVYSIQVDSGTNSVYVGGSFFQVGADTRNYLAEIDATTGTATAWDPNMSSYVDKIKIDSGTNNIFAAGRFSTVGSDSRRGIAQIDRTTGLATSWDAHIDYNVSSLAIDGEKIYLGGSFTSVNSVSRMNFAVLDKSTAALDTSITASASSDILSLAISGNNLYLGGNFVSFGGVPRNRLAAIDPTSGQITSWSPSSNGTVYALAADDSNIYIGGSFSTIDGTTRNKIAAVGSDGTLQSWDPNISGGDVKELAINSDSVFAGGTFSTVASDAHSNIAKIDKTTGVASAWDPSLSGGWSGVMAIALDSSTVYVGGGFTSVGETTRNHLAALDLSTAVPSSWDPNVDGDVSVITMSTSSLFVGGSFSNIGATSRNKVAEIDLSSGSATAWDANLGSINNFKSIALSPTSVFLAGDFNTLSGNSSYDKVAAVNRFTGSLITGWHPNFDAGMTQMPYTLAYADGILALGGSFNAVDGNLGNGKFAFYGPISVGFVSSTTGNGTSAYNVSEGVTSGALTVGILNGVTSTQDVVVDYAVTGGTASAFGIDYTLASGVATIPAGYSTTSIPITVIDDETVESDETVVVTLSNPQDAGLSSDYNSATYTILNNDVAPPGVTVSETLGSTDVTEGGGTDTYSIVLNSAPTSPVTISLASSGGNQLSLSTSSIDFSTENWGTPVTVTVTAVDDDIAESNHGSVITHTATSLDGAYNGIGINSVVAHITDNADSAGVTITQSGGGTAISEAGLSDSYTVVLTSAPTSTVTVAVGNTSADMSVSTSSIEFNAVNWNQAVTVTVSPVNDTVFEGPEEATITHTVTSNNWNYNNILVGSVTVSITDNDSANTTVTEEPTASRTVTPPTLPVIVAPPLPPQVDELQLQLNVSEPFLIGNVSHSVELLSFTDKKITFILHSDPIHVTLEKEKPFQIDTDNNGTLDAQVEYLGVVNNEPKIRVTSLLDENETQKAVSINKGAYKTTSSQVTLTFNVKDVAQMVISNRPDFQGSNFIPYSQNVSWKLTSGAGEKTVYVRFVGPSGAAIDSSDTIQYDPNNVYDPVKEAEKKEQEKTQPKPYTCSLTEGKAYKSANSPVVYYIVGQKNEDRIEDSTVCTKRPFKNSEIFFTYFDSFKDVQVVENSVLDAIPNDKVSFIPMGPKTLLKSGSLIKKIANSKVYLVLGSSLNWLETEKVFSGLGFTFNMIQDVSHALFSQFNESPKIDAENNLPPGSIFQYRGDTNVYRLDMNNSLVPPQLQKRKITNFETLQKIYRSDRIMQLNPTQTYPDGADIQ